MKTLLATLRNKVREIERNGRNPVWWRNRVNDRINSPVQQAVAGDRGVDVMASDWDTLVVLDAARADLFEATVDTGTFSGYRRVTSRGSGTAEWTRRNFDGEYGDTIYVSGNPVVSRHLQGLFHRFIEVWREGFDEAVGTIRAEAVAEAAREQYEAHPDKRLIVHFMQPHYPFVPDDEYDFSYWRNTEGLEFGQDDRARDVWEAIGLGIADPDEVWEAYRANLEYVMEYVWELADEVDGRTVLTSDHGNAIGGRSWPVPVRTYGHPTGLQLSGLVTVPWAVIEDDRREISREEAREQGDHADMTDQLEALGYVE